jgi:hypothetical protein
MLYCSYVSLSFVTLNAFLNEDDELKFVSDLLCETGKRPLATDHGSFPLIRISKAWGSVYQQLKMTFRKTSVQDSNIPLYAVGLLRNFLISSL